MATFTNLADDKAESIALKFNASGLANAVSTSIVVSSAAASQLVVAQQPSSSATAGQAFASQPVIREEDAYGNVETGDSSTVVTTALASGGGPLQGTTTATVAKGVATFSGLADDKAGTITLAFSASGLSKATSGNIAINPAAASQLVVAQQPSLTATTGQAFASQPVVDVEDPYGNVETHDNTTVVTAALNSGAGPLQGTTSITVAGGIATFTNLADDKAETISLKFGGGGLTGAGSDTITISAAASQLVIHTQPSATGTAGQAFATQPVVYLEDQYGNRVTGDDGTEVTASLNGEAGSLQGTTTVTVVNGVATFAGLAEDKAGTVSLQFNSGGLTPAISSTIVVSPAMADQLIIAQQPSATAAAGQAFAEQPVIYEEDPYGNLETSDSSTTITAELSGGAGPLRGTTVATVQGGVATFSGLADDKAESIALNFIGGGSKLVTSTSIVISPAAASQLVIHTQPSATATAGQARHPAGGLRGGPIWKPGDRRQQRGRHGVAPERRRTAPGDGDRHRRGRRGRVHQPDRRHGRGPLARLHGRQVFPVVSTNIVVGPAAPSQLVIERQPSATALAGQSFGIQPVVYVEDQYGNLETGHNVIEVAAALNTGAGPLEGTTTVAAVGGVAAFTNLADSAAEAISLRFNSGGADPGRHDRGLGRAGRLHRLPAAPSDSDDPLRASHRETQDQPERETGGQAGGRRLRARLQHRDERGDRGPGSQLSGVFRDQEAGQEGGHAASAGRHRRGVQPVRPRASP